VPEQPGLGHLVKQFGLRSLIYVGGDVLNRGLAFLLIPLYTRLLTPADYGILGLATTLNSLLLAIYGMGLEGALTRYYFEYRTRPRDFRDYLGTVWLFVGGVTLLITVLLELVGDALFGLVFVNVPFRPYLEIVIWTVFLAVLPTVPLVLFRVRGQAIYYVLFSLGRFLAITGATIYFVVGQRQGVLGSLKGTLIGTAAVYALATIIVFRNGRLSFRWDLLLPSLRFGIPLIPHTVSNWALSVSDRLILERHVSLRDLGIYTLGYQFGIGLNMLYMAVGSAWTPLFYEVIGDRGWSIVARLETYRVTLFTVMGLVVAALSREVICVMAAPSYYRAAQVVPIVALGYVLWGLYTLPLNVLFYEKATKVIPMYTMLAAGVNIGLNLLTVPRYGIMAAAVNTVIGFGVLLSGIGYAAQRVKRVPFEYWRIGKLLIAALMSYFVTCLVQTQSLWLNLALKSLAIAVGFPVMLSLLRFYNAMERHLLSRQWQRIRSLCRILR
jgi:O-antigen/teichoic acid export membrane protein